MRALVALIAGLMFGAGLALSGMVDPQRVRGFLDIFGDWDPTLAFVLVGAVIPMAIAWAIQRRLDKPFADAHFDLPKSRIVDGKLATGAILFGVGWGLGGLCPGPAVTNLVLAPQMVLPFLVAMLAGMAVHRFALK